MLVTRINILTLISLKAILGIIFKDELVFESILDPCFLSEVKFNSSKV